MGTDRPPCRWLTVADVCRLAGAGRRTVWDWMSTGLLPKGGGDRVRLRSTRVGGRRKVKRRWLADFQARLGGTPAGPDRAPRGARPPAALEEQRRLAERLGGR